MADWYDPLQEKKGGCMNVKVPGIEDLFNRDGYLRYGSRRCDQKSSFQYGAFINYVVMRGDGGQKIPNFDYIPLYESVYIGGGGSKNSKKKKIKIFDYVVYEWPL